MNICIALRAGTVLVCWSLASSAAAQASDSEEDPAEAISCLIEARSIVELGSATEALIGEVMVARGDEVHKGQAVARLEAGLERAELELARARADDDVAIRSAEARSRFLKQERERVAQLAGNSFVSQAAMQEAETEAEVAELAIEEAKTNAELAKLDLQRARAALERRVIRSPVDGLVVETMMEAGEFSSAQSPIMKIAELDPLHVEVYAPISLFGRIEPGTSFTVRLEAMEGAHEATVDTVDRVIDPASDTFGIRLLLPNPGWEIPAGVRCEIDFDTS